MYQSYLNSLIGILKVEADEKWITSITNVEAMEDEYQENPLTLEAKKQLEEYFKGRRREFELPLDIDKDGFANEVYRALKKVGYGTTMSYQALAQLVGCPKGARAIGNAIHKNPYLIVLPCHRIIKSDGSLGGFALGVEKKKILLDLEQKYGTGKNNKNQ